ncbi:hypothetical protein BLOT_008917 [Blomia tropicalis]|nr:hypothetical protein BLOT_008917 [Blomia tropicalis]
MIDLLRRLIATNHGYAVIMSADTKNVKLKIAFFFFRLKNFPDYFSSICKAQSTPVTPGLSNQKYMRAKWIKNGGAEKVQSSPIGIHGFGGAVFD